MTESLRLSRLASEVYDDVAASGQTFDLGTLAELLAERVEEQDGMASEVLYLATRQAVESVDKRRTQRTQTEAPTLFDDLDRTVKLGDGTRRRKGSCDAGDMARHMQLIADNLSKVNAAAAREQNEYARLLPYLTQGMTVEQAATAYLADNVA